MKTKLQTGQRKIKGFEDFLSRAQVNYIRIYWQCSPLHKSRLEE